MTEKIKFTSKHFYKSRFHNAICHVILSTRHVVSSLVVLSCLLVMSCFRHILLKKLDWTLDPGAWTQDLPAKQKNVKKLLQITLPYHLLKFCRKRNRNNVFVVKHT